MPSPPRSATVFLRFLSGGEKGKVGIGATWLSPDFLARPPKPRFFRRGAVVGLDLTLSSRGRKEETERGKPVSTLLSPPLSSCCLSFLWRKGKRKHCRLEEGEGRGSGKKCFPGRRRERKKRTDDLISFSPFFVATLASVRFLGWVGDCGFPISERKKTEQGNASERFHPA